MPFHQPDSLRYYTFELFAGEPVEQAAFTRRGGVSPAPWAELNVGATVGDEITNVRENKRRSFDAVRRRMESMADSWLVHGRDALVVKEPTRPAIEMEKPPKADILLTDKPEVTLFMRYADCVPILLYDPIKRAVGLAHAGWQGTVKRTAAAAVEAMQSAYGSRPADLLAAIGPAIGPDHYEIGPEVAEQMRGTFGADAEALLPKHNGSVHFDLWTANRLTLEQAGVRQIEVAGLCTACHLDDWFSHRAEKGRTGRFGALIGLKAA